MTYLTTRARFCAAKKLWNPALSEEENRRAFGPCARTHGHDYLVEATLRGDPDPRTGLLYDILKLREILDRKVVGRLDHTELDRETDFLKGSVATVEALARRIHEALAAELPPGLLHEVKVWESEEACAAFREE